MAGPDQYLKTQVMTASPFELHLMVVNGAIRYAKHAEKSLTEQNFEVAHFALTRSREFVGELIAGLRSDQGSEVVDKLKGLFQFVHRNLARADLEHDPKLVHDAVKVLEIHRETWNELGQKLAAQAKAADSTRSDAASNPTGPHFAAAAAKPARLSRSV